jgi:hypothetical protein
VKQTEVLDRDFNINTDHKDLEIEAAKACNKSLFYNFEPLLASLHNYELNKSYSHQGNIHT